MDGTRSSFNDTVSVDGDGDGRLSSVMALISRPSTRTQGFLLWVVSNSWQRALRLALEPIGITYVQFLLLEGLGRFEQEGAQNLSQATLSRRTAIDEMMTSQVVRTLENKGLVERLPHPTDSRSKVLRLTDSGRGLLPLAEPIVDEAHRQFFAGIGHDATAFASALERLTGNSC